MKLEISTEQNKKPNILTRIVLFLLGVLIASSIFTISLKIFEAAGIIIAIIILTALSYYGIKTGRKGGQRHAITLGIIVTAILAFLSFFIGVQFIGDISI